MKLAFDCECFSNFFCVNFFDGTTHTTFRHGEFQRLLVFLKCKPILIGYNNFGYDDIMLKSIIKNPLITKAELHQLNNTIIGSRRLPNDLFKIQYAPYPWAYSIDMYQITNKKGGLKEWECRQNHQLVVDTPVDFKAPLPDNMIEQTVAYCRNDTSATWLLAQTFEEQIELRGKLIEMYDLGTRPYVLGDAGIAQAILIDKYSKRTGGWSTTAKKAAAQSPDNTARIWNCYSLVSPRVSYSTNEFKDFFDTFRDAKLEGDTDGGKWQYMVNAFKEPITLGAKQWKVGVGGIHSVDLPGRFRSTKEVAIIDLDVTSFYPSLIIEEKIYPKHIGPAFVEDYRTIRDMRLAAKKAGDRATSEALKIVLNSTFGKFNDIYSPLRSVPSALRVTLNGQLMILMLVEALEQMGARILSGNTDGVTLMWHRDRMDELHQVKAKWEKKTGHQLEEVEYTSYIRRDINNYCALTTAGKVKTKGAFEQAPIGGKTDERIVKEAAMQFLFKGTPLATTVNASTNIKDFIYYTRAKAGLGLSLAGKDYGRTLRWYVGRSGQTVCRICEDGGLDSIPNGKNAVPILALPASIPSDLNRDYYIHEARRLVESIACPK